MTMKDKFSQEVKTMKLRINAREGHYDLLHPGDKSVSVHMDLPNGKYINIAFDVDESAVGYLDDPHTWADTAIQLIDLWLKKTWISTSKEEVKAFREMVVANQKAIDLARLQEVVEEKRAKMIRLGEQIGDLEKDICELLKEDMTTELMKCLKPEVA